MIGFALAIVVLVLTVIVPPAVLTWVLDADAVAAAAGGDALAGVLEAADRSRRMLAVLAAGLLVILAVAAPSGRRVMWVGRGLVGPALVLAAFGVAILAAPVLMAESSIGQASSALQGAYGPVLLGSLVLLGIGAWLAFGGDRAR